MMAANWRNTVGEFTGLRPFKSWHDGKQEFKSEGAAEAALRALRKRGERAYEAALRDGHELRVYPCREGGRVHFHIGHKRDGSKQQGKKG